MSKKRILVICFSRLYKDPRVIRQVQALEEGYDIETIGYSPYNEAIDHNTIEQLLPNLFLKLIRKILSFLHAHGPLTRFLTKRQLNTLTNLRNSYDLIICNELYPLPLAHQIAQKYNCKLLLDLHEYYPSQFTNTFLKRWEHKSYLIWLCRKYIPLADYTTSVCMCVSDKYSEHFGIKIETVISNATAYNTNNRPIAVNEKIRLVHHGIATPKRDILTMMNVMRYLPAQYELHFYLVASFKDQKEYLKLLKHHAIKGKLNVIFHAPVETQYLSKELNQYDIGLYILPPSSINNYCALPNKLFEFIQARLAIAVSPNPEMKALIERNNIGVVADDYSTQSMVEKLKLLTVDQLNEFKMNADSVAYQNSSEISKEVIRTIVHKLIG